MSKMDVVVFQILLLLPVRSLLRFKCVCKEWCRLVKSDTFKDAYLALRRARAVDDKIVGAMISATASGASIDEDNVDPFIDIVRNGDGEEIGFKSKVDPPNWSISFPCWYDDYKTLFNFAMSTVSSSDFEFEYYTGQLRFIHHVCGIVCYFNGTNWFDIILVNPALKESIKLPMLDLGGFKCHAQAIGLGYDDATNEYKVVAIVTIFEEDSPESPFKHICLVYRLSTNSWTILGDISAFVSQCYVSEPYFIGPTIFDEVIFSHGSIHWCMFINPSEPSYQILAFNFTNETFHEMKLPTDWIYLGLFNEAMYPHLFTVDKSTISLVAATGPMADEDQIIEVWVMKEYGDSDSWTKQYSITTSPISSLPRFSKVLCFWKKDHLLISSECESLVCYDLCKGQLCENEESSPICMSGRPSPAVYRSLELVTGHESLVSLKQGYDTDPAANAAAATVLASIFGADSGLKFAAMLVGEDPTQAYALICGNCHMHNGLARKEDFPYITYYCPHCNFLNKPKQTDEVISQSNSLHLSSSTNAADEELPPSATDNTPLPAAAATTESSKGSRVTCCCCNH